ncbi:MAG: S16 family serine protease [Candidatus Micrarchaeota archaeon]|mgnify:CR=1 FL=1
MARNNSNNFFMGGLFVLGILVGLLIYQNFFPPTLVERVYSEQDGKVSITTRPLSFTEVYNSRMPVLAVKSDDNAGIVSYANIEVRSGKGRVLINTNPFVEPDTQFSAETAVNIAEKTAGVNLDDRDVILTFEANTSLVGGPSAGAAITIATLAAIQNKRPKEGVAMTGTIEPDGSIGQVGGVLEKAQAASEGGFKLFLVPKGFINLIYYEKQVKQRRVGPFVFQEVSYVPHKLDLAKYAMDKWKLEVKEVANIMEARTYFEV